MFKIIIKFLTFSFIVSSYFSHAFSNEQLIKSLKEGEKIIFIRHALAPGSGDPSNFKLYDCGTQRNLNIEGIQQSQKIGLFFSKNKIPIDKVLSSEWCRCKDTAKFAFNNYQTFDALNSFFSERFQKNKAKQMNELQNFLKKWKSKKNLVLITHYVVILEALDKAVSSGEIVVTDKNLNLIGSISKY